MDLAWYATYPASNQILVEYMKFQLNKCGFVTPPPPTFIIGQTDTIELNIGKSNFVLYRVVVPSEVTIYFAVGVSVNTR